MGLIGDLDRLGHRLATGELDLGFEIEDEGLIVGRKMLGQLEPLMGRRVVVMSQDVDNEMESHVCYLKSFSTSATALGREITITWSPS